MKKWMAQADPPKQASTFERMNDRLQTVSSNKMTLPSKHSSWWKRLSSSSSEDIFRTSWSRRIYSPQSCVFRRRLQGVLVKINIFVLVIRLQNVFKTSFQDVFKTFSRRLQEVLQKRLQDIFKTSSKHFEDAFETYSTLF